MFIAITILTIWWVLSKYLSYTNSPNPIIPKGKSFQFSNEDMEAQKDKFVHGHMVDIGGAGI